MSDVKAIVTSETMHPSRLFHVGENGTNPNFKNSYETQRKYLKSGIKIRYETNNTSLIMKKLLNYTLPF